MGELLHQTAMTTATVARKGSLQMLVVAVAMVLGGVVGVAIWPQSALVSVCGLVLCCYLIALHDCAEWVQKRLSTPPTTDLREVD